MGKRIDFGRSHVKETARRETRNTSRIPNQLGSIFRRGEAEFRTGRLLTGARIRLHRDGIVKQKKNRAGIIIRVPHLAPCLSRVENSLSRNPHNLRHRAHTLGRLGLAVVAGWRPSAVTSMTHGVCRSHMPSVRSRHLFAERPRDSPGLAKLLDLKVAAVQVRTARTGSEPNRTVGSGVVLVRFGLGRVGAVHGSGVGYFFANRRETCSHRNRTDNTT